MDGTAPEKQSFISQLPQPFWANILALQGSILCVLAMLYPTKENLSLAVIAVGSNLVSGALGAFAATNQHQAKAQATLTTPPSNPTPTTTTSEGKIS